MAGPGGSGEYKVINKNVVESEDPLDAGDIYAFGVRNDGPIIVFDDYENWASTTVTRGTWDDEFTGGIGGGTIFSALIGGPTPTTLGDFDTFFGFEGEEETSEFDTAFVYFLILGPPDLPPIAPRSPPTGGFFFEALREFSPFAAFAKGGFFAGPTSSGVIPVPAALPLMLSGLVGLGLIGWRKRRAA